MASKEIMVTEKTMFFIIVFHSTGRLLSMISGPHGKCVPGAYFSMCHYDPFSFFRVEKPWSIHNTVITKSRLFKYTENVTTKKWQFFRLKNSDIFHISA